MLCRASERWNSRRWAKRRDQVRQIQGLIDALEGLRQAQLVRESLAWQGAGSNGAALARAGPGDVTADSVSIVIDRRPKLTETPGPAESGCMRPHPYSVPPRLLSFAHHTHASGVVSARRCPLARLSSQMRT